MARKAQDGLSIMRLQVTFLFSTSTGNFLVKKSEKNAFRRVPIFASFDFISNNIKLKQRKKLSRAIKVAWDVGNCFVFLRPVIFQNEMFNMHRTMLMLGQKPIFYEKGKIIGVYQYKFPLTPMGVLTHRLCTLDRLLGPPSTRAEIFRRMCLQSHL